MDVQFAFIADLSPLSEYPTEEEELLTAGVSFSVQSVEFDRKTEKYLIHLKLRQRFNAGKYEHCSHNYYSSMIFLFYQSERVLINDDMILIKNHAVCNPYLDNRTKMFISLALKIKCLF
jgi:hypothetical protein